MTMHRILVAILAACAAPALAQSDVRGEYDPWADFPAYPVERNQLPEAGTIDRPSRSKSAMEPIYVRNVSSEAMWVGFRAPDGSPARAICVEPGNDARVEVGDGRWSVRVIALRRGCVVTPRPACDVSASLQGRAIQIGGGPNPCAVREIPPPPAGLKSVAGQGNLTTRNDTASSMWVTIYRPGGTNRVITASGCVPSGTEAKWSARPHLQMQNFWVRAELMPRADCRQPPKPGCDTTMQLRAWKYRNHENDYRVSLKGQLGGCWWDNPYQ